MTQFLLHNRQNKHYRFIFPVGQGGFAFEILNNTTIVYDCGSLTSLPALKIYVNLLVREKIDHIDYLFISHFDEDHVNGLAYLLQRIPRVTVAIMSRVPDKYQLSYNMATKGTYRRIINMLQRKETRIEEVDDELSKYSYINSGKLLVWEWIGKTTLRGKDWKNLDKKFRKNHINIKQLNNPIYVNQNRSMINKSYKEAFGPQGPNSRGLIMLSHALVPTRTVSIYGTGHHMYQLTNTESCLYTGDNYLKGKAILTLQRFIAKNKIPQLLLLQVPHHGSNGSSSSTLRQLGAYRYYVCDKSNNRYAKNKLAKYVNTLMVKNAMREMIITMSNI